MKKKLFIIILIYLCCPLLVKANEQQEVKLAKCVDGDTAYFIMDQEKIKVRFLAVDTPETKHPNKKQEPYGKEASNYTCNNLTNAQNIILEFDDNATKKDKYDRYLAWIFVDGKNLQESLVKNGLAKVAYLYDDYKYVDDLKKAEKEAKNNKLNIWSDYQEEYNYSNYIIIFLIVIVSIFYIFNKAFRKKTNNSLKRKGRNYLKKQIKKSDLFK